jgi:hypothetical protein
MEKAKMESLVCIVVKQRHSLWHPASPDFQGLTRGIPSNPRFCLLAIIPGGRTSKLIQGAPRAHGDPTADRCYTLVIDGQTNYTESIPGSGDAVRTLGR